METTKDISCDDTNRDEVLGSNRNALPVPQARDRRVRMIEPD